MKLKILSLSVLLSFILISAFSQEKSKKEIKEEQKLEKRKYIEDLVNSQEFVFVARFANPPGGRQVDLATNPNYVKYHPELMDGFMPFFGRAYSGIGYGGDSGIKFKDKPIKFTVEKGKKSFQIDAEVKGQNDTYRLSLTVSFEGSASLSVISNNRGTISYQGEIRAPEKSK